MDLRRRQFRVQQARVAAVDEHELAPRPIADENEVAGAQRLPTRCQDHADTASRHDIARLEHRTHAVPLIGIDGEEEIADQHLAGTTFAEISFDHLEIALARHPGRTRLDDDLPALHVDASPADAPISCQQARRLHTYASTGPALDRRIPTLHYRRSHTYGKT